MSDLETLKAAIDKLSRDELNEIYSYLLQHRQSSHWLVLGANLAQIQEIMHPLDKSDMSEDEINHIIDEAIDDVRREYKARADT
jgi:hypothetical protein